MARRRLLRDDPMNPDLDTDGNGDAWNEPGSDLEMDFDTLVRVKTEAQLVEARRARKVERKAE